MSLKNSKRILEALTNVSFRLSNIIVAAEGNAEDFAKSYRNDKDAFRTLIASGITFEKIMRKYLRELSEEIVTHMDWGRYSQKLITADATSDIWSNTIDWDGQRLKLEVTFYEGLMPIFGAGMQAAHTDANIATQILPTDAPAIKALRKYGLNRAKLIESTTKERIKESIVTSLQQGLSVQEAADALIPIVDDPARARLIARTEQVQAYSEGRKVVGDKLGAKGKIWDNGQAGACSSCTALHNMEVAWEELFPGGQFDDVWGSPLHPNCRCGWHMVL